MQQLQDALESLIDGHGLYAVTDALAQVCHDKAEHLRGNWQDAAAAKRWARAASVMQRAEVSLRKIQSERGERFAPLAPCPRPPQGDQA